VGGLTATYVYDGDGNRVEDTAANRLFWYGASGNLLEMTDAGSTNRDYIYFAGRRIARYDSGGTVSYLYDDADGSLRTMTDAGGNQLCWADYYPFGESAGTGCSGDNYQFAGLYSDATGEDGGHSATHRRYSDTYFRWFSPDPAGRMAVDPANPQTWNMYAYVGDNPATLNDPSGLLGWEGADCNNNTSSGGSGAISANANSFGHAYLLTTEADGSAGNCSGGIPVIFPWLRQGPLGSNGANLLAELAYGALDAAKVAAAAMKTSSAQKQAACQAQYQQTISAARSTMGKQFLGFFTAVGIPGDIGIIGCSIGTGEFAPVCIEGVELALGGPTIVGTVAFVHQYNNTVNAAKAQLRGCEGPRPQ